MQLVKMPRLGQDMERGTLVEWAKSVGERVQEGEMLAVIETEKAEVAFESPGGGYLVAVLVEPGATAATGTPIAWIADDPSAQPPSLDSQPKPRAAMPEPLSAPEKTPHVTRRASIRSSGRKPVSPLARRRARELGVDLAAIAGTGPGGRVTEEDVMGAHQAVQARSGDSGALSRMRLAIAAQMSRSAAIPQFQLMREVVLKKPHRAEGEPKISYTDMVLWAAARALGEVPALNASWIDGDPPSIRVHPQVNLGLAVAVEEGLIVPVIRNAASLGLAEMASERRRIEGAVRKGRLRSDQLQGGTFTVSNLGGAGVDQFVALINPPEAAILAVGAVKPRPVVVDGAWQAAPTVRMTLTGDHRVFDGMEGARFLAALAAQLQSLA